MGSTIPGTPTIAFGGTTTALDKTNLGILYQTSNPYVPQRILFPYNLLFAQSGVGPWPSSGETPAAVNASIQILQQAFPATSEFFFLAGADPYFTNVLPSPTNPNNDVNAPWLSEDLRVFTATPGAAPASQYQYPVPGGPKFVENSTGLGHFDVNGAFAYIQALINHLNAAYGDPQKTDPFDPSQNVIPGQQAALTGDSSVTPFSTIGGQNYNNYSFALARVRLRGTPGQAGAADGVKVFFRLWQTQTADTDWNPTYTYLSNDPTGLNPGYPEAPSDDHTIPFFATGNAPNFSDPSNPEFGSGGPTGNGYNNQDIVIGANQGDQQWAYYGCFLNVNDPNNVVNGAVVPLDLPGTHHCLVAQIAYSGAPIESVGGQIATPENSSLLAQRNLQVTTSDNPGPPSTHRVPQTFDIKPSAKPYDGTPATYPDELMILWGDTPVGSTARIYWPQANSAGVLQLASWMYGTHPLAASDAHTIECKTAKCVTYVPIPSASGASFAGLFTLDLPPTVVTGQEFNIVVRRISNRPLNVPPPPPPPPPTPQIVTTERGQARAGAELAEAPVAPAAVAAPQKTERYIVGSFQVKVPVSTAEAMLPAEETTLAIMKARLGAMSPSNRWRPVLIRYIGLISARVQGLGGDPDKIAPSLGGYPQGGKIVCKEVETTGKVCEVIFDCHGDFAGFVLGCCEGERRFHCREPAIFEVVFRAYKDRLTLSVIAESGANGTVKGLAFRI